MNIDTIHWHDSVILGVYLNPGDDILCMRLLYPEDWQNEEYVERTVVFENAYGYKEVEGPFAGQPTILSASIVESGDRWQLVRMETNCGYREVYCVSVSLEE